MIIKAFYRRSVYYPFINWAMTKYLQLIRTQEYKTNSEWMPTRN
jgi:hypothetical protein